MLFCHQESHKVSNLPFSPLLSHIQVSVAIAQIWLCAPITCQNGSPGLQISVFTNPLFFAVCSYAVAAANDMTSAHVGLSELAFILASQVKPPLNCSLQSNIHSLAMNLHKYGIMFQPLFESTEATSSHHI